MKSSPKDTVFLLKIAIPLVMFLLTAFMAYSSLSGGTMGISTGSTSTQPFSVQTFFIAVSFITISAASIAVLAAQQKFKSEATRILASDEVDVEDFADVLEWRKLFNFPSNLALGFCALILPIALSTTLLLVLDTSDEAGILLVTTIVWFMASEIIILCTDKTKIYYGRLLGKAEELGYCLTANNADNPLYGTPEMDRHDFAGFDDGRTFLDATATRRLYANS